MPSRLKVAEVFRSIQGEGPHAGVPAVFVRTAGCNLRCWFCDTKYAWEGGQVMSAEEVADKVSNLSNGVRMMVLTGGEPLLQAAPLAEMITYTNRILKVEVETNGTVDPSPLLNYVDFWVVSPKVGVREEFLKMDNVCFKFPVDSGRLHPRKVDEFVEKYSIEPKKVWLSPRCIDTEEHMVNFKLAFEHALRKGYNVTARLHVLAHGKAGRGV